MSSHVTAPTQRSPSGPPPTATLSARVTRRKWVPPRWLSFVTRKGAHLIIVLLAVTFLVSMMLELLPGDPARVILGPEATDAQVELVRNELHLDQPAIVRYWYWLTAAVQGDLGVSFRTGQPVAEAIIQRIPVSVQLMVMVQVFALVVAIAGAVYATYRPNGWVNRMGSVLSLAAISIPGFVLGLFLVYIFAVTLGVLPASGYVPPGDGLWLNFTTMLLPAIALALEPMGVYFRVLRGDMQSTMKEDFVLAAQAKGMSASNVLLRQVFRPSSFSLVTLAGINTARLIGSAVVIETLFALPGLGRMLVDSVYARDYVTLQGVVAVIAVFYVVTNIVIDLLYLALDPRVRSGRG